MISKFHMWHMEQNQDSSLSKNEEIWICWTLLNHRVWVRWNGWNRFTCYDQNGHKESTDQVIRVVVWLG